MKLSLILHNICSYDHIASDLKAHCNEKEIDSISCDSRQIKEKSIFVALKGVKSNGQTFIEHAIKNGAAVVIISSNEVLEEDYQTKYPHIPFILLKNPSLFLAKAATLLAGEQPHHIAAITGTNGKSSIADFLRQLWLLQHKKAASLGTLGLIADIDIPSLPALTTPDAVSLAQSLSTLKQHHIDHVALEASSHGLEQYRLHGLSIERAAFTNLTRDHLDYHQTIDNYRAAKLKLLTELLPPHHIFSFNADMDEDTLSKIKMLIKEKEFDYRDVGEKAEIVRILNITPLPDGQELLIEVYGEKFPPLKLPFLGRFQAENALLAASLCWDNKKDAPSIIKLLPLLKPVAGRCEYIGSLPNQASVYVDYAHTPDALEHILKSLLPHTHGKLHVIFGAGGNRDKGKRPLMGKVAASYAQHIILTDDNPRHEEPRLIREEIAQGIKEKCLELPEIDQPHLEIIPQRADAIEHTIAKLGENDLLIIAGKGHEQGQIIGDKSYPFDDAALARQAIFNISSR